LPTAGGENVAGMLSGSGLSCGTFWPGVLFSTTREYLNYLADLRIGTIIAGDDRIDMRSVKWWRRPDLM